MNRFLLKKIYFNNREVSFNEGENYIIGANGTGKTMFFDLIQHIMGLNRTFDFPIQNDHEAFVECLFGDKKITIKRKINSKMIKFEGDINIDAVVRKDQLESIYSDLLYPEFYYGNDTSAAFDILQNAFISESNIHFSKDMGDTLKKVLGVNIALPVKRKQDLVKFKKQIELDKNVVTKLENFIQQVDSELRKRKEIENVKIDYVLKIMEQKFKDIYGDSLYNNDILHEADDAIKKMLLANEDIFIERVKIVEPYFNTILNECGLQPGEINWLFEGVNNSTSMGMPAIQTFAILFTMYRVGVNDKMNSLGFLVNDSLFGIVDPNVLQKLRKWITKESKNGKLQYIEFTRSSILIPKNSIIMELKVN